MQAPDWFLQRLDREFGHRLRLRWSLDRNAWHIEERVGRAAVPPFRISERDDRTICARDGYAKVLEVSPGDRMPCPECHLTVKVPHLTFTESTCSYCRNAKQREGRWMVGYYPLGEALLQHLRSIDPERHDLRDRVKEIDADNAALAAATDKSHDAHRYDILYEDVAMRQLPKVGYQGPTPYWNR